MKKSFLQSRAGVLAHRPLVVGTLLGSSPLKTQLNIARSSGVDLIELRLDGFSQAQGAFQKAYEFGRSVIREIKSRAKLPILLTFRAASEQGKAPRKDTVSDARRSEILARLLPSVEMVDVEVRRPEFAKKMTVIAHVHGVDVIHSAHDFKSARNLKAFENWSKQSVKLKGDVFKVAVLPSSNDDLERFMNWGMSLHNPKKVLIGMGSVGKISRVVAYSYGSILTYGHLGSSAAPGQMPAKILAQSIHHVYQPN